MSLNSEEPPTEKDALSIARDLTGEMPASIERFSTGNGHWVYDVRSADGSAMVVRMGAASQREDFLGAIHWSRTLRPLGVPLPELIAAGDHRGLPYVVLERLPGRDLEQVYSSLSVTERQVIAEAVCDIQRRVGTMPSGTGYGFLRLPGDPGRPSWSAVVEASLARSRARMEAAGLMSLRSVDLVSEWAGRFAGYFSRVRATPFLDDVTTKNVLVHAGRLSGIVDVDWVCYGDALFTVALTRTAILSAGAHPDYTDHWCDVLALTEEEREVVRFYTALFCVDFMSEYGQKFNRDVRPVNQKRLSLLERMLREHLEDAP